MSKRVKSTATKVNIAIDIASFSSSTKDLVGQSISIILERGGKKEKLAPKTGVEDAATGGSKVDFNETLTMNVTLYKTEEGNYAEKMGKLIVRQIRGKSLMGGSSYAELAAIPLTIDKFVNEDGTDFEKRFTFATQSGQKLLVDICTKFVGGYDLDENGSVISGASDLPSVQGGPPAPGGRFFGRSASMFQRRSSTGGLSSPPISPIPKASKAAAASTDTSALENEIAELKMKLERAHADIENTNEKLKAAKILNEEALAELKEKDETVENLTEELRGRDAAIDNATQENADLKQQMEAKESEMRILDEEHKEAVDVLNKELDALKNKKPASEPSSDTAADSDAVADAAHTDNLESNVDAVSSTADAPIAPSNIAAGEVDERLAEAQKLIVSLQDKIKELQEEERERLQTKETSITAVTATDNAATSNGAGAAGEAVDDAPAVSAAAAAATESSSDNRNNNPDKEEIFRLQVLLAEQEAATEAALSKLAALQEEFDAMRHGLEELQASYNKLSLLEEGSHKKIEELEVQLMSTKVKLSNAIAANKAKRQQEKDEKKAAEKAGIAAAAAAAAGVGGAVSPTKSGVAAEGAGVPPLSSGKVSSRPNSRSGSRSNSRSGSPSSFANAMAREGMNATPMSSQASQRSAQSSPTNSEVMDLLDIIPPADREYVRSIEAISATQKTKLKQKEATITKLEKELEKAQNDLLEQKAKFLEEKLELIKVFESAYINVAAAGTTPTRRVHSTDSNIIAARNASSTADAKARKLISSFEETYNEQMPSDKTFFASALKSVPAIRQNGEDGVEVTPTNDKKKKKKKGSSAIKASNVGVEQDMHDIYGGYSGEEKGVSEEEISHYISPLHNNNNSGDGGGSEEKHQYSRHGSPVKHLNEFHVSAGPMYVNMPIKRVKTPERTRPRNEKTPERIRQQANHMRQMLHLGPVGGPNAAASASGGKTSNNRRGTRSVVAKAASPSPPRSEEGALVRAYVTTPSDTEPNSATEATHDDDEHEDNTRDTPSSSLSMRNSMSPQIRLTKTASLRLSASPEKTKPVETESALGPALPGKKRQSLAVKSKIDMSSPESSTAPRERSGSSDSVTGCSSSSSSSKPGPRLNRTASLRTASSPEKRAPVAEPVSALGPALPGKKRAPSMFAKPTPPTPENAAAASPLPGVEEGENEDTAAAAAAGAVGKDEVNGAGDDRPPSPAKSSSAFSPTAAGPRLNRTASLRAASSPKPSAPESALGPALPGKKRAPSIFARATPEKAPTSDAQPAVEVTGGDSGSSSNSKTNADTEEVDRSSFESSGGPMAPMNEEDLAAAAAAAVAAENDGNRSAISPSLKTSAAAGAGAGTISPPNRPRLNKTASLRVAMAPTAAADSSSSSSSTSSSSSLGPALPGKKRTSLSSSTPSAYAQSHMETPKASKADNNDTVPVPSVDINDGPRLTKTASLRAASVKSDTSSSSSSPLGPPLPGKKRSSTSSAHTHTVGLPSAAASALSPEKTDTSAAILEAPSPVPLVPCASPTAAQEGDASSSFARASSDTDEATTIPATDHNDRGVNEAGEGTGAVTSADLNAAAAADAIGATAASADGVPEQQQQQPTKSPRPVIPRLNLPGSEPTAKKNVPVSSNKSTSSSVASKPTAAASKSKAPAAGSNSAAATTTNTASTTTSTTTSTSKMAAAAAASRAALQKAKSAAMPPASASASATPTAPAAKTLKGGAKKSPATAASIETASTNVTTDTTDANKDIVVTTETTDVPVVESTASIADATAEPAAAAAVTPPSAAVAPPQAVNKEDASLATDHATTVAASAAATAAATAADVNGDADAAPRARVLLYSSHPQVIPKFQENFKDSRFDLEVVASVALCYESIKSTDPSANIGQVVALLAPPSIADEDKRRVHELADKCGIKFIVSIPKNSLYSVQEQLEEYTL